VAAVNGGVPLGEVARWADMSPGTLRRILTTGGRKPTAEQGETWRIGCQLVQHSFVAETLRTAAPVSRSGLADAGDQHRRGCLARGPGRTIGRGSSQWVRGGVPRSGGTAGSAAVGGCRHDRGVRGVASGVGVPGDPGAPLGAGSVVAGDHRAARGGRIERDAHPADGPGPRPACDQVRRASVAVVVARGAGRVRSWVPQLFDRYRRTAKSPLNKPTTPQATNDPAPAPLRASEGHLYRWCSRRRSRSRIRAPGRYGVLVPGAGHHGSGHLADHAGQEIAGGPGVVRVAGTGAAGRCTFTAGAAASA